MSEPRDGQEPGEVRGEAAEPRQPYAAPGQWQPGWAPPPISGAGWGPGWAPPPPPKRRGLPVALAAVLVVAGAGVGVGVGYAAWGSHSTTNASSNSNQYSPQSLPNIGGNQNPYGDEGPFSGNGNGSGGGGGNATGGPSDVDSIAKNVNPALVDINVSFGYQQAGGAGTGIVLTSNGEILTNNHVIDGATSISVTDVGNGKTYGASVVGYDSSHDVAVLQLKNASGLTMAKIGNSSKLSVGQAVVAIGNANGSGGTPTSAGGSVTALDQSITASDDLDGTSERLSGLIVTNADVQSGDSGGSLVDTASRVVGLDTAASDGYTFPGSGSGSGSGSGAGGQGYAIPINQAMSIAKKIEWRQETSTIHIGSTAFLGVSISTDSTGSGPYGSAPSGAEVAGVQNGGAAAAAGIQNGDVITSLDGKTITSPSDLSAALITRHPGDTVKIAWTDTSGQTHSATVQLRTGPPA